MVPKYLNKPVNGKRKTNKVPPNCKNMKIKTSKQLTGLQDHQTKMYITEIVCISQVLSAWPP